MSAEGYYEWRDDSGELLAYVGQDEDGDLVALSPTDGSPMAWYDSETGEQIAVADEAAEEADDAYSDDDGYDRDEYAAQLEQRLADAEARLNEPRQVEYVEADDDGYDADAALALEVDRLEGALDRPLTIAERRRIWREAIADQVAGQPSDAGDLAERLDELGEPLINMDSGDRAKDREARHEFYGQRFADLERLEDADDDLTGDSAPPQQTEFDPNDRQQRQEFMVARLEGHDVDLVDADNADYTDYSGDE